MVGVPSLQCQRTRCREGGRSRARHGGILSASIAALMLVCCLSATADAEMLDLTPEALGGDPTGTWDADSLEIDISATPTLRAAVSDLVLSGFVDGQISLEAGGPYRFDYQVDVDVSLTFLGGPLAVSLVDTVSETGVYAVQDNRLVLTRGTVSDTVAFSVMADTLSLIQEVPLGDFAGLAASIDPDGGPPVAVLKLHRVADTGGASADFDGDGSVGFTDFLLFAASFGSRAGDPGFESKFDLDSDGSVSFTDFLVFVGQFDG